MDSAICEDCFSYPNVPVHPCRPSVVALGLRNPLDLSWKRPNKLFDFISIFALDRIHGKIIPSTEVIKPTQGFSSGAFGRRTRSLGKGGRRGGGSFVLTPFGGILK